MKSYSSFKKAIIGSAFSAVLTLGAVTCISAQNADAQYRQWQRAQQEAAQRQQDYMRTRSMRDYRQWQQAQARAQREYNDYQRATSGRWNNNGYNNGYYNNNSYNNGSYNNGSYNNGYYNNDSYNNNSYNNGRYRVYANGSYYEVDSRGVALLRQAVQNGYNHGYRQGQEARRYGRGSGWYTNDRYYQNGTYGWQSTVGRDQYRYYYQQGFQKGYEDGYNSTLRYGTRSGNGFNILGNILNTILNISDR